ncbi:lysophospholipid acyltransferase family protein [Persicitalea jodogahamensis]|uniref:1-acyl-sn-glycerol-3-phosphate acyltransferase n=1 Tax=Persicitalea jodogahamensis TaxID=402147 RepID=A0A8J3D8D7_9BACT|nr:lysophospholipid acyltransferase family protein [Persicitalea jodogahamensis]GHB60826.1 1-acyl-sn-glycerol-3-phosphate acyltransferase [Persicitalea jodogahamensis]
MKKVLDYLLSVVYLLFFGLMLLIFHVTQLIAYNIFGKEAHKKTVVWFNFCLVHGWYLTGSHVHFEQRTSLPDDRPIIFVANHQSMFDIPGLIWFLRKYYPLFVSKIELAHGIPGISYNLRVGGAALIDRKDGKKAVVEIAKLGKRIHDAKGSAAIFPEGTRSSSGVMKAFAVGGLMALLKKAPDALVVPVAIQGTGKFNPKGLFPLISFTKMSWTVLPGIEPSGKTLDEIAALAKASIQEILKQEP